MNIAIYNSPIGLIEISGTESSITSIYFIDEKPEDKFLTNNYLGNCIRQLNEYFNGVRREFDLHLEPEGTEFQKKVWKEILEIPFGITVSYLFLARKLGNEKAIRAVANANGQNKISIIIPCHRIIGGDGSLTGYGGGLWRKKWLLEHEQKFSGSSHQMNLF